MGNQVAPEPPLTAKQKRKLAQERERDRYIDKKAVEQFVINVYATCPRIEAMWLLLSNIMGQRAFSNFVSSEKADEYFTIFMQLSSLNAAGSPSNYQLLTKMNSLLTTYFLPDAEMRISMSPFLQQIVEEVQLLDPDAEDFRHLIYVAIENIQNEMVYLMARDQFSRFIVSKFYKQWRASESSHAAAATAGDIQNSNLVGGSDEIRDASLATIPEASVATITFSAGAPHAPQASHSPPHGSTAVAAAGVSGGSRAQQLPSTTTTTVHAKRENKLKSSKVVTPLDLSYTAFSKVDRQAITDILDVDSWLATLVAAVEALPVSFTLAKPRPDRKALPFIYANKYFMKTTGHSHVLGKAAKDFMQCKETDREEVAKMSEALATLRPVVVKLKNIDSKGRIYPNVVALKPIVDAQGRMLYVVGLHFDVTKELDHGGGKMALAEELLSCIPTVLSTREDEQEKNTGSSCCKPKSSAAAASSSCTIS